MGQNLLQLALCGLSALCVSRAYCCTLTLRKDVLVSIFAHLQLENIPSFSRDANEAFSMRKSMELFTAVESNDSGLLSRLLKARANVNIANHAGITPFEVAVRLGFSDCVHMLMPHHDTFFLSRTLGWNALHRAVHDRNISAIQNVAHEQPNLQDGLGKTPLHLAIIGENIDVVNALLLHADINVNSFDHGNSTPLDRALENPLNAKIVTLLLIKGATTQTTNVHQWSLHRSARENNSSITAWLLGTGADINAPDEHGRTPLFEAAMYGHFAVATLLIERDANVNAEANNGCTPLLAAVIHEHFAVATLLLDSGATVTGTYCNGYTSLHWTAIMGHYEISKLLLNCGATVTVTDWSGNTPLHLAVSKEHFAVVKLLLDRGADIHAMCNVGTTPLGLARISGDSAIAELLCAKASAQRSCMIS